MDKKQSKLTPAVRTQVELKEHKLLFLPCLYRGPCIPILKGIAPKVFQNLMKIAKTLPNQITGKQYKTTGTQSIIKSEIWENMEELHPIN